MLISIVFFPLLLSSWYAAPDPTVGFHTPRMSGMRMVICAAAGHAARSDTPATRTALPNELRKRLRRSPMIFSFLFAPKPAKENWPLLYLPTFRAERNEFCPRGVFPFGSLIRQRFHWIALRRSQRRIGRPGQSADDRHHDGPPDPARRNFDFQRRRRPVQDRRRAVRARQTHRHA